MATQRNETLYYSAEVITFVFVIDLQRFTLIVAIKHLSVSQFAFGAKTLKENEIICDQPKCTPLKAVGLAQNRKPTIEKCLLYNL